MRVVIRSLAISVAFISITFPGHAFTEEARIAGIVIDLDGPVFLKRDKKEIKLHPDYDRARLLFVGEEIRCGRGGVVHLRLCNRGKEEIRGPTGWRTISASEECPNQDELTEYGRRGGRDKGTVSPIFSPANGSVVKPDDLVFRWVPSPALRAFSLEITRAGEGVIWHQEVADGPAGSLTSDSARQVLLEHRDKEGPLVLKLSDQSDKENELVFSLLSVKEERSLEQELASWDKKKDGLMRHLGRARVFARHLMLTEVAEEYEAALAEAPESRDLLRRTIEAHQRTGNAVRVRELKKRLTIGKVQG